MKGKTSFIVIGAFIVVCLLAAGLAMAAKEEEKEEQYLAAAKEIAGIIGTDTVLSQAQLLEELEWFAKAAAPYRGEQIRAAYESVPLTMWEAENLGPLFEKLTGIKAAIEGIAGDETMRKMRMEAETKQGSYDTINIDQDMVGFFTFVGGAADLTELMEEHPELNSPFLERAERPPLHPLRLPEALRNRVQEGLVHRRRQQACIRAEVWLRAHDTHAVVREGREDQEHKGRLDLREEPGCGGILHQTR